MSIFRRRRSPELPSPEAIAVFWQWWAAEGARRCAQAVAAGDTFVAVEQADQPARRRGCCTPGWPGKVRAAVCPQRARAGRSPVAGDPEAAGPPPADGCSARPHRTPLWAVARTAGRRSVTSSPHSCSLNDRTVAFPDMRARDRAVRRGPGRHRRAGVPPRIRGDGLDHAALRSPSSWPTASWAKRPSRPGSARSCPSSTQPAGATDLAGLRTAVLSLAEQYSGPEPTWRLLERAYPTGQVVIAMARVPLVSAVAPQLDGHLRVELPYVSDEAGLPADRALDDLHAVEERVEARGRDGRTRRRARDDRPLAHSARLRRPHHGRRLPRRRRPRQLSAEKRPARP